MILLDTDHLTVLGRMEDKRHDRLASRLRDVDRRETVAVTNDALLLSANISDFERVPGLRTENWLK